MRGVAGQDRPRGSAEFLRFARPGEIGEIADFIGEFDDAQAQSVGIDVLALR